MRFYKFCGDLIGGIELKANNGGEAENKAAMLIAKKTAEFNGGHPDHDFVLASVGDGSVTFCLISRESKDSRCSAAEFASFIGLEVSGLIRSEITLEEVSSLLDGAEREEYIESESGILKKFGIEALINRYSFRLQFGEGLVEESVCRSAAVKKAKRYGMNDTLLPELGRIYGGKKRASAMGHPVHYIVETDDRDVRRDAYKLLLDALYFNNRLDIRRYVYTDLEQGECYPKESFESLYKLSEGGAVVVRVVSGDSDDEEESASEPRKTVERLCEVMKRYRNKVLSVVCFPTDGCKSIKEIFYGMLSDTAFVEIKEDALKGEDIKSFLDGMARKRRVKTDEELYGAVDTEREYLRGELSEIFEGWYTKKLKNSVYPQYKDISSARCELMKSDPKGEAYRELSEMIGLTAAKQVIKKAVDYFKMRKLYEEYGINSEKPSMHMCFVGNPGTAKTTVARLFAEIMRDNGVLSSGHLVEVGRGALVGKYTGWTAQTVTAKFKEAEGGVLFIDEAYSLVDDRDGSYGDEAINAIVQEMENHRENTVVIFAGYKDKMEEFIKKNPGLRSRIAFHVPFEDYDVEELCGIARNIVKKSGMRLGDDALKRLEEAFAAAKGNEDFGNGRFVRNMIEGAKMNQASRILAMDISKVTVEEVATITAEDIELPEVKKTRGAVIGFVA